MSAQNKIVNKIEKTELPQILETSKPEESLNIAPDAISEKISETVGENGSQSQQNSDGNVNPKDNKAGFFENFLGFSTRLRLLVDNKQDVKIPSRQKQISRVSKAIRKEQKILLKKANKIINSRNFSASKYEQIIQELRILQSILSKVVYVAKEKLVFLYKKYFLKSI